ncbi:MAG: VacB/RNase II family 3'-5' exoribonuclease [Clostridiales bacterium]|nr:VacB/RNase II family 3'-5' exoribonuclease [Clostridiales bacterium]
MKKYNKHIKKRNVRLEKPKAIVTGVLRGNSRGFAFLSGDNFDDIFIPAKYMGDAMHGDTVEVEVYSDHGEVKKIINMGASEITGTYVKEMRTAKVIPDDKHYSRDIYVTGGKAEIGDRVVVKLSRKDRGKGEIIKILGKTGTLESDIAAVIFSLGIEDFKYKAIKEAEEAASQEITTEGRRDFTSQPCFTIDGEGSKDFDDAVYAEKVGNGFRLWVHIADVAHYVPLYSHTDKEAFRRGNSFYYGESVIPMLPEVLCNDVCSLNENVPRYTLTAIMDISECGNITGGEICEGVICSHKRMTYEAADKALHGQTDEYAPFMDTLRTLHKLRDVLKKRRDLEGNIDFDIPEPKFAFENGKVVGVQKAPRLLTHSIIEECMIAANRFVAEKFLSIKAPFVYREHQPPQNDRVEELNTFLEALGENAVTPTSIGVANLLNSISPEKRSAVSRMALRCMSKAKYSVTSEGHFGLAIKEYCHFTSPIRRYSDLTIHRVIKAHLHGEDLNKFATVVSSAAAQASEREKLSERAEREIDELYIADYMAQFVGGTFDGVISGVTEWGIYVELDNTAEGMIRAETLGITKSDQGTVSMTVRGRVFRLGDKIKVMLISVQGGNLLFELV